MKTAHGYALRVSALYGGAAAFWILVTGWLASLLPRPYAQQAETVKGLFFVLVTTLALYAIIYRWSSRFLAEARYSAEVERRFTGVVRTVPTGVLLVDTGGVVTYVNPAAAELIGAGPEVVVGRPFSEFTSVSEADGDTSFEILLRTGAVVGIGLRGRQDSERRAAVARVASLDADVPDKGWVVALADITESHQESTRLRALMGGCRLISEAIAATDRAHSPEQLLRSICGSAVLNGGYVTAWAVVTDPETGRSHEMASAGVGNATREAIQRVMDEGKPGYVLGVPVSGDRDIAVLNDVIEGAPTPWREAATADGFGSLAFVSMDLPEGQESLTLVLFAREPGFFDHDQYTLLGLLRTDVVHGLGKLVIDARLAEAESALGSSERNCRDLFMSHPQVMWVYDKETLAFLEVNDTAIAKYGYSHDEFLSMKISDIRAPGEAQKLNMHVAGKPQGFSDAGFWTHVDAAHRTFPVHVLTHTLEWEGRPAVLVLIDEVAQVGS